MRAIYSYINPKVVVTAPVLVATPSYVGLYVHVDYIHLIAGVSVDENFIHRAFEEGVSVSDSLQISLSKPLQELVAASEEYSFSVSKPLNESVKTTDSFHLETTKNLTEQVQVNDSGSMRMTSYADFSYFAEDYVGSSRIF